MWEKLYFVGIFLTVFVQQFPVRWVWRCSSVFPSTDAVRNAVRADSVLQTPVRDSCTHQRLTDKNTDPDLWPLTFWPPQFPSRRWSRVCPPPPPGTVKAPGPSAGAPATSPPKPGCPSDTSWTVTSTQWTPPTDRITIQPTLGTGP